MAFATKVQLKGADKTFKLADTVKKYTLRDYGFQEGKQGNFEFERVVKPTFNDSREVLFKMKVAADLSGFTMTVTNLNGMQVVNVYKNDTLQPLREAVENLQADLVERGVLEEIA
ncbi:hypothetical protein EF384_06870 [Aerococcus agrisoli]|uniref:Cysteine desulfurase n=1 Tax=Aerococcus agrisoli TaxID=2487350 RepID=A0A3N4GIX3_9LACT|nr:hypothetical protein [Aerococcus agrisoli]RPA59121.1 hypothetical protein EF384_06870 [Aerococcus agrisoli]